jgi:hypothetical protein
MEIQWSKTLTKIRENILPSHQNYRDGNKLKKKKISLRMARFQPFPCCVIQNLRAASPETLKLKTFQNQFPCSSNDFRVAKANFALQA